MQYVILPVHGFHFFKVAKGHNIKAKLSQSNPVHKQISRFSHISE